MCQIIAMRTTLNKFRKIMDDRLYPNILNNILEDKGGDYFSVTCFRNGINLQVASKFSIIEPLKTILKIYEEDSIDIPLNFLLFSRQQPEMEKNVVEEQPYRHNISNNLAFSVHGTIYNDKELAELLNVEISADTEILKFINPNNWDKANGTFCAIGITPEKILTYEHGLHLWKNRLVKNGENFADLISTTSLKSFEPYTRDLQNGSEEDRTLFVSFSGGMDIALSTYRELQTWKYNKVILNYFAWGSIAEKNEIISLEKFKDFYSSEFNIPVEIKIWPAVNYFEEFFKITGAPHPKISKNNPYYTGEEAETESPIAYVPYRNTQFAILLASHAEAMNLKNVNILFGLNLSEGMVYMDNSEGWLEAVNQVVKYGGKDYKLSGSYLIISPYFTRTKTNMLKEFKKNYGIVTLEQLLLLSKSCYYPQADGSPCGKCGSCLLRQKAIETLKGK